MGIIMIRKQIKNLILVSTVGVLVLIFVGAVSAQNSAPIGTVVASYGKVFAQNQAGKRTALNRNSSVFLDDLVVTEENGKIQIRFNDDTYVFLKPMSQYKVSEFKFRKENPKDNRYTGNIIRGTLVSISGQGKPNNYQYNSPLAIIGVRGTAFALTIHPKKEDLKKVNLGKIETLPESEDLLVFHGLVSVKSVRPKEIPPSLFRSQSMLVGAGQPFNGVSINNLGRISKLKGAFVLPFEAAKTKFKSPKVTQGVLTPSAVSNVFSNPLTPPPGQTGTPPYPGYYPI